MAINYESALTLKDDIVEELEQMTWKVVPFYTEKDNYRDKDASVDEVVNVLPVFVKGKDGKNKRTDEVDFYQIRVAATFDMKSKMMVEDDFIYFNAKAKDVGLFDDLKRRDRITVTIDRNAFEYKVGSFAIFPKIVVNSVQKVEK